MNPHLIEKRSDPAPTPPAQTQGGGLQEAQLDEMRHFARQLAREAEVHKRSIGKAILLLVDEVGRLRAEVDALIAADPDAGRRFQTPPAGATAPERRDRKPARGRLARRRLAVLGTALALAAVSAVSVFLVVPTIQGHDLDPAGPQQTILGPRELAGVAFSIAADSRTIERAAWELNDVDVSAEARVVDGRVILSPTGLADGEHRVTVTVDGSWPKPTDRATWVFTVDTTPPSIELAETTVTVETRRSVRLSGRSEPGSTVTVAGETVELDAQGSFLYEQPWPPPAELRIVATDPVGNQAERTIDVVHVPRDPGRPVRAVHVSFGGWADPTLRQGIVQLIDEGRINAVELDLKDEGGIVGFETDLPFARKIGAVTDVYNLEEAVRMLHGQGVRVIGRLVAFRDPVHAAWAWETGKPNQVVQTDDGGLYAGYGGFTNFANPVVRQYNIDVAIAAAEAGVDEILYDYVRRPDGPPASMTFPGLQSKAGDAIAGFLAEARRQLEPYDVLIGASVFGVAATRPGEVAQPIRKMAREIDYISPMLYPSHWNPGEYDVSNPNAQPYEIVVRSLADFQALVEGTGARLVPWLQDFSLGHPYGPAEVRAQIQAAGDLGIDEWLLWDPAVDYTASALERDAPRFPPPD